MSESKPPPGCREPFQIPADQPHDPTTWWAWDDGYTTRDEAVEAQRRFVDRVGARALREAAQVCNDEAGSFEGLGPCAHAATGSLQMVARMLTDRANELDPAG